MELDIRKGFTAYNTNWKENLLIPERQNNKYFLMRPNQLDIYSDYKYNRFMIVRQPPGAGKSATIKFAFAEQLEKNPDLKILIAIPQNIIGSSFGIDYLEYPNGKKITWKLDPLNDLTLEYEAKVKRIIKFLNKDTFAKGIQERILLCSHAGLVRAYQKMKKTSFKNTIVIIDEAHHVQASGEDVTFNNLGHIVKKIINSKDKTCGLWFTTATYFRGDGVNILSKEDEEKFETYFLPLDEYFESLKYIRSYSYNFIPYYGLFPKKEIQILLKNKERQIKTIVYVPCIGRLWAEKNKKETVNKLKKSIQEVWKDANILDLVTENGREKRKKMLMDNKYSSNIDVVLAVHLLDEGTDWPEVEQVLDLAPSNSLRIQHQRLGRLLRDMSHKKHLYYYVFFPFVVDFNNVEECRFILSKNFTALSASFILEENISPVKLPKLKKKKGEKDENKKEKINYFTNVVSDCNKRDEIRQRILESLQKLRIKDEEEDSNITSDDYRKCITDVLKNYKIGKNIKKITAEIELELARRAIPEFETTIDIENIVKDGFDKVKWIKITDYICHFISGKCTKKMLKELKEYYDRQQKTIDEHVKYAEELAYQNRNGELEEILI